MIIIIMATVQVPQTVDGEFSIDGESTRHQILISMGTITKLHVAAYVGDLVKVISLINSVDCCICRDDSGNAVLHHAAMGGHLNVVKYLTTFEAVNPASPGKGGMTPLHFASIYGYMDIVTFLINKQLVDPLCYNDHKQTPFFLACKYGHLQVAKTILKELLKYITLEDIVYEMDACGITVIHAACLHNHLNIATWLLSVLECNPNTLDSLNRTPLHYSAQQDCLDIVKLLIECYQCSPSCQDVNQITPLHLASQNGH